ncbi:MAG: glycosyltransferase [Candidatus Buchananbacteria bacterium]
MKIAIICTNLFNIDDKNKTGSGIFNHILINSLAKLKGDDCDITVFASGESASLPAKVESIDCRPTSDDQKIIKSGKHIMFELALISKAFAEQDEFDAYHVNIGDGDLTLPFAAFVKKPILITLHNILNEDFTRKYFSLFKDKKNVFFVSASDYQRKILPDINYLETIYHGIDTDKFSFNPEGGGNIMWAGRFISGKGPDIAINVAQRLEREIKLFGIIKSGYEDWFEQNVRRAAEDGAGKPAIKLHIDYERSRLIEYFQTSKLLLLPSAFEEAFGLVFAEAMSCGTPVVTFARGSAPEVIEDGVTGFLVNPSNDDIRGNWIIKKTGFDGLCEAAERIYSLSPEEYKTMRLASRKRAEKYFSADKMAEKYLAAYKKITG